MEIAEGFDMLGDLRRGLLPFVFLVCLATAQ